MFGITLLLNFVLWAHGSSAALPFLTILALIGLWFGVSMPLTFVGAFFGFRKRVLEHPVRHGKEKLVFGAVLVKKSHELMGVALRVVYCVESVFPMMIWRTRL